MPPSPSSRNSAPRAAPEMQAPFIWFGGKRKVAAEVWAALGDVDNFVEPFAGSLAVLLGRPGRHRRRCETDYRFKHYGLRVCFRAD